MLHNFTIAKDFHTKTRLYKGIRKEKLMADLSITGGNTPRIDTEKWKRLTPQEIIKEESKGEEIPAEIVAWAQQITAFSKIPDNVTYERRCWFRRFR